MWAAFALIPAAFYLALLLPNWSASPWRRRRELDPTAAPRQRRAATLSLAFGFLVAIPVEIAVRGVGARLGVDPKVQVAGAWLSILTSLFVFGPIEEAAKAGIALSMRSRFLKGGWAGVLVGAGVAGGFACLELGWFARDAMQHGEPGVFLVARSLEATIAHLFAGSIWGYALGRVRARGRRFDRSLVLAWTGATLLRGLYDHLIFARGLAALLGSIPLFVGIVVVAYLGARELGVKEVEVRLSDDRAIPKSNPPPSLRSVRAAFRRAERPVKLRWIAFGAVITVGVIVTAVAAAVLIGLRIGVDFGAVDEGEVAGAVPLGLIGLGVLLAFPLSGFLVARASGADSVLEAALSTAFAIVGTLILLGLAAPVAVVFALAVAPIAFALACAGAWVGIGAH